MVSLNRTSATAVQSGGMWGTRLQVLQKLQNRAARIVTNSSYDSSASALIKTLNEGSYSASRELSVASCQLRVVSCELSVASWFFLIFCEL